MAKVDLQDKSMSARFYQFVWKLFFWNILSFQPLVFWLDKQAIANHQKGKREEPLFCLCTLNIK